MKFKDEDGQRVRFRLDKCIKREDFARMAKPNIDGYMQVLDEVVEKAVNEFNADKSKLQFFFVGGLTRSKLL